MRGLLSRLGARINSSPRWDCKATYVAIEAFVPIPAEWASPERGAGALPSAPTVLRACRSIPTGETASATPERLGNRLSILSLSEPVTKTKVHSAERARRRWGSSFPEYRHVDCLHLDHRQLHIKEISLAPNRLSIPSFCRRSVRCRPPRRRGYGGQRRPDDSVAHRAYKASRVHCRY